MKNILIIKAAILFLILIFLAGCSPTPDQPISTMKIINTPENTQANSSIIVPSPTFKAKPSITPSGQALEILPISDYYESNYSRLLENSVFGLQLKRTNLLDEVEQIKQLEPSWFRKNGVVWSDVEPQEGIRNWDKMETIELEIEQASKLNMETILIVRSTPSWAQVEQGLLCGAIKPEKLQAFGNFMYDLVSRYSQPPYNVKYWEIWNEPDAYILNPESGFGCWADPADEFYGGGAFADMLITIYPRIKDADPEGQVIIGGLLLDCDPWDPPEEPSSSGKRKNCDSSKFLEGILINNGGDYFDGVGFHAYDYYYGSSGEYGNSNWHSDWKSTGPVITNKAKYIRQLLDQYAYPNKFLMNTESALLCIECEPKDEEFELTKAQYISELYAVAIAEDIKANIWFSFTGWRNSGLVDRGRNPLPAFAAFQTARESLGSSVFIQYIDIPNSIGLEFFRANGQIWIFWSRDNQSYSYALPDFPLSARSILGESIPINTSLDLGRTPIYLSPYP